MSWFTAERLYWLAVCTFWLAVIFGTDIASRRRSRAHDQAVADMASIHRHRQAARSIERARRCHPSHKDST